MGDWPVRVSYSKVLDATLNTVLYGSGTGNGLLLTAINATATKMYLQQFSSGAPSFQQIAYADISGTPGAGVTSIAGTANQIAVSASTGAVTLSFPNGTTGSGAVALATSATLVTPTLGVATATRIGVGTAADAVIGLTVSQAQAIIHLVSTTTTNPAYIQIDDTVRAIFVAKEGSTPGTLFTGSLANAAIFMNNAAAAIQLGTSSTIRATISSAGGFSIGTATDPGATNLLIAGTAQALRAGFGVAADSVAHLNINGMIASGSSSTLTFGPGGSAAIATNIFINGSSNVGSGPALFLATNSTNRFILASTSAINGAGSISDYWLYNLTGKVFIYSNNGLAATFDNSQNTTLVGTLGVSGTGPNAFGTTTSTDIHFRISGTYTSFAGANSYGLLNDANYVVPANSNMNGAMLSFTLTEAGSGTHAEMIGLRLSPAITNGAATTTDAIVADIRGWTAGAGTSTTTSLRVSASTGGGSNNVATFLKNDGITVIAKFYGSGRVDMPNLTTSSGLQTAVVCLDSSGQLISDSVACLASSEKYKENINTYDGSAIDLVNKFRPITFSYKSEGIFQQTTTRFGFIAEEVASIRAELGGYDTSGILKTIDDRGILAITIKAIQEQQLVISVLEERIDTLRERLNHHA